MRLLLLGCTGFVGKELVPTLLNENHEIYIVSRKPISKLKLDLDFNKIKFFQIDLSKEKNWNNENLLNILEICNYYSRINFINSFQTCFCIMNFK